MITNSTISENTQDSLTSLSNIIWDKNLTREEKKSKLADPLKELRGQIDAELKSAGLLLRDAANLLRNVTDAIDTGALDKIPDPKKLSMELGKLSLIFNAVLACTQSFAIDSSELMKAIIEIFAKLRINKAEDNRALSELILKQADDVKSKADSAADNQRDAEVTAAAAQIVVSVISATVNFATIAIEANSLKRQIANSDEAKSLADDDIDVANLKAQTEQHSADLAAAKNSFATAKSAPNADQRKATATSEALNKAQVAYNDSQSEYNKIAKNTNNKKNENRKESLNLEYGSTVTKQASSGMQAILQAGQSIANVRAADIRRDGAREKNLADFGEAQKSMSQNALQSNIAFMQSLSDTISQCLQLIGSMIEKYEQMIQSASRA